MRKVAVMVLVVGASVLAGERPDRHRKPAAVPEISVGSAGSAGALLLGTMLVLRGRRKKSTSSL